MSGLRPFWRYYGGKWRAAPHYPRPRHDTIIEPFAGAAGYSLRYPDREIILVEKYHVIAEIWRWLIKVSADEVLAIPDVDAVDDLPKWVPQGARWLVGYNLAVARQYPAHRVSPGILQRRRESAGRLVEGWTPGLRSRIATQVLHIRHWRIIEGDYTRAPQRTATWFIDPPYQGELGRRYSCSSNHLDYAALARWCRSRRGLAITCEAQGATWLPFWAYGSHTSASTARTREAIWLGGRA